MAGETSGYKHETTLCPDIIRHDLAPPHPMSPPLCLSAVAGEPRDPDGRRRDRARSHSESEAILWLGR